MKRNAVLPVIILCFALVKVAAAQQYRLTSPNGYLNVYIHNSDSLFFSLAYYSNCRERYGASEQ